jgi:hypothetical protein
VKRVNWLALSEELAKPLPKGRRRGKERATHPLGYRSRAFEDRLNSVCPGAWSVNFKPWGEDRIICELTIHEVTRSAIGEVKEGLSPVASAEALAFKRACTKFGLGLESPEPTLSRQKATQMHRRLARCGLARDDHYRLASKALRREVKSLTTLTGEEASKVWQEAKKKAEKEQAKAAGSFPRAA